MTDDELRELTDRCIAGDPTAEAAYEALNRRITPARACGFSGCKAKARWVAHKLWGKGGTLQTCDRHKPRGRDDRPWYRLEPINPEES